MLEMLDICFFALFSSLLVHHISGSQVGDVKATYWAEQADGGSCQMPQNNANYVITDALALGQSTALGHLAFRSGFCGQVLTLNCGHGAVDALVVSTCGIGSTSCGLDLIGKTWRKLTNNQEPGIAQCNVTLSKRNPIEGIFSHIFPIKHIKN